ncbi:class I SAM-dependent methyltransferase [Streptomyces sp. NBC_01077]|uniref:class I SAM-dependent methyltransferase n=1 Tax=Streptomyces sp. NBC_01077 TaxID=2903746 RepID=UPI0038660A9C|nr:class I SAM-dependent methyltransferase [Streptomyces sp. NBC_01077]WSV43594.1 class I SAM-dependent methyltransferase [Streptomyces sp. NBC_01077]
MTVFESVQINPGNSRQARAWDGDVGIFWAKNAERFNLTMRGYRKRFFNVAAIRSTDRILDIGCGSGETARDAARFATCGSVLGVDLSAAMLEVAERTSIREGLSNIEFQQSDAQVHPFPREEFDVAISRTGTMFFSDPASAFSNVATALRPGGRLVQLVWQAPSCNEWFTTFSRTLAGCEFSIPPGDEPGPFSLLDPDRVRDLLTGAGFAEPKFEKLSAPMNFGHDADDAFWFISTLFGWMLGDAENRDRALADLRANIESHAKQDGIMYSSATWLITAERL